MAKHPPLNTHGGREANKRALLSEVVGQEDIDVLFLQETRTTLADGVDWGVHRFSAVALTSVQESLLPHMRSVCLPLRWYKASINCHSGSSLSC